MADQKATQLTELTTVADGDILYIVDDPGGTPVSKKITKVNLVGSGGNTFARIVKKADETVNNSTTFQDDDELVVALNANKTYGFILLIYLDTSSVADIKETFTIPSGASGDRSSSTDWSAGNTQVVAGITSSRTHQSGGKGIIEIWGRCIVVGTAGNLQFQWAQNALEVSDTKVLEGSTLIVWEETA